MERHIAFFLWGIFLGLPVVVALLWFFMEKRRSRRLAHAAKSIGCHFPAKDDPTLVKTLQQFEIVAGKERAKAWNIFHKSVYEGHGALFELRFGAPGNAQTISTVFQIVSPHLALPSFCLHPMKMFDRAIFASRASSTFSQHYTASEGDSQKLQSLLSAPLLTYYEHHTGLFTEGNGHQLIIYVPFRLPPSELGGFWQ